MSPPVAPAEQDTIEAEAPPWENPLGEPLRCHKDGRTREYFPTQAEAGTAGSNFHVRIWEERQNAEDYVNNELIWGLITYNKNYQTWQSGVSLEIESVSVTNPWGGMTREAEDFDSTDDARDACSGIHFETTAKRTRTGQVSVDYHFSAMTKSDTSNKEVTWSVSASVTNTATWEVSGKTTPPSASGSVGGQHSFTIGGSYSNAEGHSYTTSPVKQAGKVSIAFGGR